MSERIDEIESRLRGMGQKPAAKPPVRESGPGRGLRGNREVPPRERTVAPAMGPPKNRLSGRPMILSPKLSRS